MTSSRVGTRSRIVVAGTGGGVGTTTVTALLFAALVDQPGGAPALLDHSAGALGRRLAEGDEAARLDIGVALHDLGAHALDAGPECLDDHATQLLVVTAATPAGLRLADAAVSAIEERRGAFGLWRTTVVCEGVFGRHRIGRDVDALRRRLGWRRVIVLRPDPALAEGGRIPLARLSARSRRTVTEIADVVRSRRT
jgi:hypothetical protein